MSPVAIPSTWRYLQSTYRLVASHCVCGRVSFPPRIFCSECKQPIENRSPLSGKGILESWTVIHSPPEGWETEVPYVLGLIKLNEGPRVTAQLVGIPPEEISSGMKVKMAFRRLGSSPDEETVLQYGYKFVPEEDPLPREI